MNLGFLQIGFERPLFLLLLLLVPVIWYLSFGSLAGLGKWRRFFALVLRSIVFSLLVLALAQVQWKQSTDRLTVIYLLDQSESVPKAKREFMLDYVHRAVKEHRREERADMAGVIIFGGTAKIEAAPYDGELPLIGRIESDFDLNTGATSIESAMKLAKASFPEGTARRLVLITDGNENLGDAVSMAQAMANEGTGIDVVPVDLFANAEVSVDKVVLPSDIRKGQDFEARVVLTNDSTAEAGSGKGLVKGKLRLSQITSQREELVAEEEVTLEPGKNVIGFQHRIDRADVFTFDAKFVPDDDTQDMLSQNNQASAFTHVRGKGRVLLIEDGNFEGEFASLIEKLQENAIEVEVMPSTKLFESPAELLQYDSVILANLPKASGGAQSFDDQGNPMSMEEIAAFSDKQVRMLVRNCEEFGCGIVMLGGDRSFGAGGWANSELEKAMPVDFQIKNDKIDAVGALVLMLHACEMPNGNHWQTVIARKSIEVLGPMDFCGVVEWTNMGGGPTWLWKMPTGVDRVFQKRKTMMGMVGRMAMGDMPDFNGPMRLAISGLKNTNASMKHMVIISDGDPTPPTARLLRDYVKNKIKISTVVIGSHSMNNPMQRIAKVTGGNYYVARNPKALPKIFQREARRVAKPVIKESEVGMQILFDSMADSHEILQGVSPSDLPPVYGYVMTTVKNNPLVEQLWMASDPADNRENTTLLATWRYGNGRTTVFTSDGGHKWTSEWVENEQFGKLFSQAVRHSMRPITQSANFTVGTDVKDNRVRVVVNALDKDENFLNFLNINAAGIDPDLNSIGLEFKQVGPGRYVAEHEVSDSGNFLFSIFPGEGYERLTAGINVPYSSEYSDRESNRSLLESLAGFEPAGGETGAVIEGDLSESGLGQLMATNTFRPTLTQTVGIQDAWPLMVLLCGMMFFADVFVRRVAVRFDWIGEYISEFKSKRNKEEVQHSMARLQSRKAEIEKEIETRRSKTRFAPELDDKASGKQQLDQVIGDEIDETADRKRPKKRRDTSLNVQKEEQSYTSRLLDAKRKAQKKQNNRSDFDDPESGN